jgi:hypothetical protein
VKSGRSRSRTQAVVSTYSSTLTLGFNKVEPIPPWHFILNHDSCDERPQEHGTHEAGRPHPLHALHAIAWRLLRARLAVAICVKFQTLLGHSEKTEDAFEARETLRPSTTSSAVCLLPATSPALTQRMGIGEEPFAPNRPTDHGIGTGRFSR